MQTVILYRYKRADGGYSVSPNMPQGEYDTKVRLIADDGKALTDGNVVTQCTDTDSADGWMEIDATVDEEIEILNGE